MSFLTLPDVKLYYELSGSGPPVLLIQGVGVVGGCWQPQIDELKNNYQTLLFDNRGIGRSVPTNGPITIETMAADALALMDSVGWESAHVVGHSMGGVIAQHMAIDCPKRVRGLSLLCTFHRGKAAARLTPQVLWAVLRTRIGSRASRRRAFLKMIWSAEGLKNADRDALAAHVASLVGRDLADNPPILMKQLRALGRHDIFDRLSALSKISTLVVSAAEDPIARPHYGKLLAEAMPGARFVEIPSASHGVTIEKPALISKMLADFLGKN